MKCLLENGTVLFAQLRSAVLILLQKLLFFVNLSVEVRMNNKEKMIKIENGSVKKDLKIILSELNFELHKGNVVAIKGTAGSGKTTFAQLLAGEISLYEGVFEKNETFFPYFVSQQDNFFLQTSIYYFLRSFFHKLFYLFDFTYKCTKFIPYN